jgi:branched-chain amino acid transport system permease protein
MSSYDSYLLAISGTNAIAAWGLSIAIRSGQLSLGHAAFAGVGAYTSGYLMTHGHSPGLSLIAALAVASAFGLVFSVLTLRMNHLLFAISTLVFAQICIFGVQQIDSLGGSRGIVGLETYVNWRIVAVAVAIALAVELVLIRRSGWGLRIQLLAHDPVLTDLTGKAAAITRMQAFTLSAGAVAVAGVLRAHLDGVVIPENLGFATASAFLVYAVVGGAASSYGPFVGAILLTQVTDRFKHGQFSASIILGLVLLVVCLVRPNGLLTRRPLRIVRPESSSRLSSRLPSRRNRTSQQAPAKEGTGA